MDSIGVRKKSILVIGQDDHLRSGVELSFRKSPAALVIHSRVDSVADARHVLRATTVDMVFIQDTLSKAAELEGFTINGDPNRKPFVVSACVCDLAKHQEAPSIPGCEIRAPAWKPDSEPPAKKKQLVARALRRLRDENGAQMTLRPLAEELGVSACHLSRCFKEITGRNLSLHVREMTLKRAMGELRESGLSVKELAHKLGFRNADYFSAWFRNLTGQTPTEFRTRILRT